MNIDGIEAITFDAVGTLIIPNPSVGAIYAEELAWLGYEVEADLLEKNFREAFKSFKNKQPDALLDRQGWSTIVALTLQGLTPRETFDKQFETLWNSFAQSKRWHVLPHVKTTLHRLQSHGFRLYVLSNNDERLLGILNGLEIDHYFEAVFVSASLGAEKPSGRIFELVQQQIQVTPANILHVGDSLKEDVEGALQAGWQAALVGTRSQSADNEQRYRYAKTLDELFTDT